MINFFRRNIMEIFFMALIFPIITGIIISQLGNYWFGMIILIILITFGIYIFEKKQSGSNQISQDGALKFNRRAVVFTVGLKSHHDGSPLKKVLSKLHPEYCAFLSTKATIESGVVKSIVTEFKIPEERYIDKVVNESDIENIRDKTVECLNWFRGRGVMNGNIVVDITGGNVVVSVAAYMGAMKRMVDTQYIYSEFDKELNQPLPNTQKAVLIKHL